MADKRDHGGNLDAAIAGFGGVAEDWIDLSTGINRVPYPLPRIAASDWQALPTAAAMERLRQAARAAYGTEASVVPLAGAQAAIQMVPGLRAPGVARVLAPTYNEHAACLRAAGWRVEAVTEIAALDGADIAVVVNPNNPDGRITPPARLRALARRVGLLVVDESFADATPDLSLAPGLSDAPGSVLVMRSFGKFYGLAGLRLGFALAAPDLAERLVAGAGPWPVSGPAIAVGCAALGDRGWQEATARRLMREADRLDAIASGAGWSLVGGSALFRTYRVADASAAQDRLARHRIWSRVFPYDATWIRLGLPGGQDEWARLEAALG